MSIARVVAWADQKPTALIVSVLALRKSLGADVRLAYGVLASGLRLDIALRVKRLLEDRGVQVDLREDPGWDKPQDREAEVAALLEEVGRDASCQLALDISGAGPEAAILSLDLARKLWRRPFQIVAFDAGRGAVRLAEDPVLEKGLAVKLVRFDVGDPTETKSLRAAAVGPGHLLGLYGMRLMPEDPYGLPGGKTAKADGLLVEAARGVLEAFVTDGSGYARFRGTLAGLFRGAAPGPEQVVLEARDLPAKMRPTIEALKTLGLACDRSGGSPAWILKGPRDRSAVFALKNRLFVISCKNDFFEENLLRHADRLRALAAEFGEALVRPVLVSTRRVEGALEKRCRAYEVGHVSGPKLLSILQADASAGAPRRLLNAVQSACPGPPMPGTGGA